jgi:hypothetical protein
MKESVQMAAIIYETLITWLCLTIGIQIIVEEEFNVSWIAIILCSGAILCMLSIMAYQTIAANLLRMKTHTNLRSPGSLELYYFRIFSLIEAKNPSKRQHLLGIFTNHIENCKEQAC